MRRIVEVGDKGDSPKHCEHGVRLEVECASCERAVATADAFTGLSELSRTFVSGYEAVLNDLNDRVNG